METNPVSGNPICTVTQLRAQEKAAAGCEPPLMERAGAAAAAWAEQLLAGREGPVLVLAGPGNNGGDAYVVARCLRERGFVVHLATPRKVTRPADAMAARERWLAAGGEEAEDFADAGWALVVDGLFGVGLSRPPAAVCAAWIARVNAMPALRLALDLPSGLEADSGRAHPGCLRATHTASFLAHAPGCLTLDGPDHCGELRLFDLGVAPPAAAGRTLGCAAFAPLLRARRHNTHKGQFGAAAVIGGTAGMQGAALLAARAALHLGPGKVYAGLLAPLPAGLDLQFPEIMCRPPEALFACAQALAIGPGLGLEGEAPALLQRAIAFDGAVLFDADALNLLAAEPTLHERVRARAGASVLTPHPAEAARLLDRSTAEVQADRVAAARELAARFGAVVVLKGCGSVVASPAGAWFINRGGHGGMASGGMGDALSGLALALLAQGWPARDAALCAVHLHTRAAEVLAAAGIGPIGLRAGETLEAARRVFNDWCARGGEGAA